MSLTHHLPGQTPIDDWSGLKVKGITLLSELNFLEAENIARATAKYLSGAPLTREDAPFDFAWALQLHREMFGNVWAWAGQLRVCDLNLGVPFPHVETALYDLFQALPYWQEVPWLRQAAMLHHRAVQIHPFNNGNGRWSRMFANIWLQLHGQPITEWPGALGGESEARGLYLEALKAADQGEYDGLVELHGRYATRAEE